MIFKDEGQLSTQNRYVRERCKMHLSTETLCFKQKPILKYIQMLVKLLVCPGVILKLCEKDGK